MRVTVEPDGQVVVVLPDRVPERRAAAAVKELAPWIERRRAQVHRDAGVVAARAGSLPYLDMTLTLRPQAGRSQVRRSGEELWVPADPVIQRRAIELWLRRRATAEITPRLDAACLSAGLRYHGLSIRGQKTRWASCSARGAMSFNWRLLLAPSAVLDYVVWHEVCHLAVMDHSPRFWALVAEHCPGYAEPRAWLRRHGATLVLAP